MPIPYDDPLTDSFDEYTESSLELCETACSAVLVMAHNEQSEGYWRLDGPCGSRLYYAVEKFLTARDKWEEELRKEGIVV
uniref:Uncharacterized protein n=1 Tax=viral metagenome TaxID=1070528 RepID=A0A6H2A027_9ZZZZ